MAAFAAGAFHGANEGIQGAVVPRRPPRNAADIYETWGDSFVRSVTPAPRIAL